MRNGLRVAGSSCLLLLIAAAQSNITHGDESRLLAVEHVWNQAEARGDVRALELLFDDSLVYVDDEGGLLSKAQFLARAKAEGGHAQSLTTPTMSVRVYDNTAVVVGTYRFEVLKDGKASTREGRFTDIWINADGRWICVAAQSTPIA